MRVFYSNLFLSSLLVVSLPSQALDITEGEWQLEVRQTISGTPVGVPTMYYRECFSEADPVPTSFLNARSCTVIEERVVHRTVHYKLNCYTEHGSIINEGKIRFSAYKITGKSRTDLGDVAGRTTVLRYSFTGRRIGDCPQ